MDIYNSFIHNCPKLEATKTFFNRWLDNQSVVYVYNVILFNEKKKEMRYQTTKSHEANLNAYF